MQILAIGAHPDDIELMCGGSLAYFASNGAKVHNIIVSNGGLGNRESLRKNEAELAAKILGVEEVIFFEFKDGQVACNLELIQLIEDKVEKIIPDIIFTHHPQDQHQDHRSVGNAVLSAARMHQNILLCESPSTKKPFDGSVFIDISAQIEKKLEALKTYRSHLELRIDIETIKSIAMYRGFQIATKYAEAFYPHRFLINSGKAFLLNDKV
jgi:LmbE family N-acetylglucosaminyl deacetylase